MRSALTRHVIDVRVCVNSCACVTPACEVTVRAPSRSRPLLIRGFVAAGFAGLLAWPVVLPPEPPCDSEQRQTYRTTADGLPLSALGFRLEHFTIGAERFGARCFQRPFARLWSLGPISPISPISPIRPIGSIWSIWSIGHWYPAGDVGEGLRRTVWASLRVVNLVAIQAETSGPQLHGSSVHGGSTEQDPPHG